MKCGQPLFVALLALVVSLASVSCDCAVSGMGSTAPESHAGHHASAATPEPECADAGCAANGGFTAVLPERTSLFVDVKNGPLDDHAAAPPVTAAAPPPPFMAPVGLPPWPDLPRAAQTPVVRFDKLLS